MSDSSAEILLSARDIEQSFGGVQALNGVTLDVHSGEIVGLIGPNGAGKSTFVGCVSGAITTYSGQLTFAGTDVTRWPAFKLARMGLIRTFQTSRGFDRMTVLSNLLAGAPRQEGERILRSIFGGYSDEQNRNLGTAMELLERFDLLDVTNSYFDEISGGQRRLVEICRAMMCQPNLLLLDEPFAGVSPENRSKLVDHLADLRESSGTSILVIEHRLEVIDYLCDRTIVMAGGRVIGEGRLDDLRQSSSVVSAYLGGGA